MGSPLIRCVNVRAGVVIDVRTGAVISPTDTVERLNWAFLVINSVADNVLVQHWDEQSVQQLTSRTMPNGDKAPDHAYKHISRLWGRSWLPEEVFGCSRVIWMGEEHAGRTLRSVAYRINTFNAVTNGSRGGDAVTDEAMRVRIAKFVEETGQLPTSLFDLEPRPPKVPGHLVLAASDKQFGTRVVADDGASVSLTFKLPTVRQPRTSSDWAEVNLTVTIPERYRGGKVCAPTVRVVAGSRGPMVMVDLPVQYPGPPLLVDNGRVLAADWGTKRLLSAARVQRGLAGEPPAVDGRPMFFDPKLLLRDSRILTSQRERLVAKLKRLREAQARPVAVNPDVARKILLLAYQVARINERQKNLHKQVVAAAAAWLVGQALACGASTIALENLASLEHRDRGRRVNVLISLGLRGQTQKAIELLAELNGLTVVYVSAYGTSKFCSRCRTELTHKTAPNGKIGGYAWASCSGCGYQGNRDQVAAENVGRKAAKAKLVRHRRSKRKVLAVKAIKVPTSKNSPTRQRPGKSTNRTRRHLYGAVTPRNRSVGPVAKRRLGAGQPWKESTSMVIAAVTSLLYPYRHTIRATPVLYRFAP